MLFILPKKFFLFLHFCPEFFGLVGKRLDGKAKVNFKIYDVKTWKTYCPISLEVKAIRQ